MLLTRLPLIAPEGASSLDLHALSAPLAFILSHDQTLRLICLCPTCVEPLTHSSLWVFFCFSLALCFLFPATIQLLRCFPFAPTVKPMVRALPRFLIGLGNLCRFPLHSLARCLLLFGNLEYTISASGCQVLLS